MTMIKFRCPHCKKPLSVRDHLAGKKANCPACKKPMRIPTPGAPATAGSAKPGAPEEVRSEAELEQLAAAALGDESSGNGAAAETATIDFSCEYCETTIQAPRSEAGKRMQCPNPECRSLVKVPNPTEDKPKDWRELAKKGPAAAIINQPEKIDEAAWGTHTDQTKAHKEGLIEAGVIELPPPPSIGPRGWIRRGLWTVGIIAGLVLIVMVGNRARVKKNETDFMGAVEQDLVNVKNPVVRGELYRAIGEYKIRDDKHFKALEPLKQALACAQPPGKDVKGPMVEQDLFLIDLALTITEVGGTEAEEIAKEKHQWSSLREVLGQVLRKIDSLEARAMAMRTLATRLLEKDQYALALGLAAEVGNKVSGRLPPAASQLVVLLLYTNNPVDKLAKAPSKDEIPDLLSRMGFAEFHARKGRYDKAFEIAGAKGNPADRVEACIGVAQVILSKGKDANIDEATKFTDAAFEIIRETQPKLSPWVTLQAIRAGVRMKPKADVNRLIEHKQFPVEFRPRALLEIALADIEQATTPPDEIVLKDLSDTYETSPCVEFGWEALARQNGRMGNGGSFVEQNSNPRFRAMIRAGATLGAKER